jgi:hypothetical protein
MLIREVGDVAEERKDKELDEKVLLDDGAHAQHRLHTARQKPHDGQEDAPKINTRQQRCS